jgi:hypothetical protein
MPTDESEQGEILSVSFHPQECCASLLGAGQTSLLVCLPAIAVALDLSAGQMAVVVSVGSGLFLVGNPFWGWLGQRVSAARIMAIALLGFALSHAIIGIVLLMAEPLAPHWALWLLLAARVVYGFSASAIYPTAQAWALARRPDLATHQVLATVAAAANAGRLLGPVLAAGLLLLSPASVMFALAGIAVGLMLMVLARSFSRVDHIHAPSKLSSPRGLLGVLFIAVVLSALVGAVQYSLAFWLEGYLGDATAAGVVSAAMLVVTGLAVLAIQLGLLRRLPRLSWPVLAGAGVGLLVSGALLQIPSLWCLGLAVCLAGVSVSIFTSACQSLVAQPGQSFSTYAGLFGVSHASGGVLGVLLAGFLLSREPASLPLVIFLLAMFALALFAWQWLFFIPSRLRTGQQT